ncbi:MAG: ATP-dependent zinc metalloprotease FtsH [Firmicutes bacterium]|nr:ATP-dependent zinc metalloprotease FtsH [Bacillota bacterium]
MKNNTKLIITVVAFLAVVAILAAVLTGVFLRPEERKVSWLVNELEMQAVIENDIPAPITVKSIEVENYTATVTMTTGNKYVVYVRDYHILEVIEAMPRQQRPEYGLNNPASGNVWNYVIYGVVILGVLFLMFMLFRNLGAGNRQAVDFGRSGASAHSQVKIRFTDVAGAEEEKEELKELVDFLRAPGKFVAAGARIPRGVLLVGPSGTGKTLFAKAVAGEANVPFFSISGSNFVELYVGVGASRVRDLFEVAKKNKPCIIFIDEIDAVGRHRGAGLGGGHDEREQTLNQLLVQMDGFDTGDDIIVIAATNRADILDPALLRPGRFDRQIYVNYPDVRGREAIFKVHSRNKHLSSDINFQVLARITTGFTGADIANLLNEAAILAARKNRTVIEMEDVYEGINKVTMGPQKKSRVVTEYDKRIFAYHEVGHALVARCVREAPVVHEVSIIPRGQFGGFTALRPENDDRLDSKTRLESQLAISMGGRAAEEIFIKDITQGASMDIKHVTSLARSMVTEWGMSGLGPVFYGGSQEVFLGRDYGTSHEYSDAMAARIDAEVEKIIEKAHKTALEILETNREKTETMVRVLIECETIYAGHVDMIMDGHSAGEVIDAVKNYKK